MTDCSSPRGGLARPLRSLTLPTYFAVVEDVRTIEVVDVEFFGKIRDGFIDALMDVILNGVQD